MKPLLPRAAAVAALISALTGCGPEPAPRSGGVASTPATARPSAPPAWPAPTPAPPPAVTTTAAPVQGPPVIVIHEAELYGSLASRLGKTVTLSVKVLTSTTQPEVGNKGVLYQRHEDGGNETWVAVADVAVKSKLDARTNIAVTITAENKDFGGKKLVPFAPNSRMKLRWEWQ